MVTAQHVHATPLRTVESVDWSSIYEVCAHVRAAIRASNLSYTVLAARTGLGIGTIGRLASGETREPRASTVFRIMVALGYDVHFVRRGIVQ